MTACHAVAMAHPLSHDPDDPALARLRSICLAFPEATEKISHGRPIFRARVTFATCSGMTKAAIPGEAMTQHPCSVLIRPSDAERPALQQDARFFTPAYYGPAGWLGLDLTDDVDWQEVAELVDTSYREVSGPRLVRLLDRQGSSVRP
jgi:hypothetical protein